MINLKKQNTLQRIIDTTIVFYTRNKCYQYDKDEQYSYAAQTTGIYWVFAFLPIILFVSVPYCEFYEKGDYFATICSLFIILLFIMIIIKNYIRKIDVNNYFDNLFISAIINFILAAITYISNVYLYIFSMALLKAKDSFWGVIGGILGSLLFNYLYIQLYSFLYNIWNFIKSIFRFLE